MSQYLVLPINDLEMTAGYKNEAYRKAWGWVHYGIDCVSGRGVNLVYACGNGEVIACGQDGAELSGALSRLGLVVVVVYRDVLCSDGKVRDLAARCYHFDRVNVRVGDRVSKDTVLGFYGMTGANTSGAHLHFELDADILHPCNAPGIKAGGKIINTYSNVEKYGLADTTIHPEKVWFVDENQSIKGRASSGAWTPEDVAVRQIPTQSPPESKPFIVYEETGRFAALAHARMFAKQKNGRVIVAE